MKKLSQLSQSASALLKQYLTSVSLGDAQATASFFAKDGYIDAPYVVALGMPSKIVGQAAIEQTMSNLFKTAPDFHFTRIDVVMESGNEVVAEYESEATLANGRYYKQQYIGHLIIKDGAIVSHKEYLNTIPFAEAFLPNGLNDLITSK